LVHISEITYGHVSDITKLGNVGDPMKVKVIGLDDGKISLSAKKLKEDPWNIIPNKYEVGDVIEGEVVRYVPYGVFIRVYDDINGLVHLSEITDKHIDNPVEAIKLGSIVKAKIILLEPQNRKIGLSIKALYKDEKREKEAKKQAKAKKEAKKDTKVPKTTKASTN
jgi:small subunit ribosomal protein S1